MTNSDITLVCGSLNKISEFNTKLHDLAQVGYEPINMSKVEMGPLGSMCILLMKK